MNHRNDAGTGMTLLLASPLETIPRPSSWSWLESITTTNAVLITAMLKET